MYGLAMLLTIPRRTTNKNIDKITFVWKKGYNISRAVISRGAEPRNLGVP